MSEQPPCEPTGWLRCASPRRAGGSPTGCAASVPSASGRSSTSWSPPTRRATRRSARPSPASKALAEAVGRLSTLCEALAGFDVRDRLTGITTPTRVVIADADPVSPPEVMAALADEIPGADARMLEDSAHLANICRPAAFEAAVREHLTAHR